MSTEFKYDVFLSHNREDTPAVERIAQRLKTEFGLSPFLDKSNLTPDKTRPNELERALDQSATTAVFVGASEKGPWQYQEMQRALDKVVRTREDYRIIPVLLPGADNAQLSGFLGLHTWVDFRAGVDDDEAFKRLVERIKGGAIGTAKPHAGDAVTDPADPRDNETTVVILHESLLADDPQRLQAALAGTKDWFAVHPGGSIDAKVMLGKLPDFGIPAPAKYLEIADEPDPIAAIVEALQDRVHATPPFESIHQYLEELTDGNIGRLKRVMNWIQAQPMGPLDSGRIPPVLYRDMDDVWEQVTNRQDSVLLDDLALTLAAARQPLSLQLLLDPRPDFASVAQVTALSVRGEPRIDADKLTDLAAHTPLRVLHRRHEWLLIETRQGGDAMVSGWVSARHVQSASSKVMDAPERVAGARRLLSEMVAMGLVVQTAAPVDGLDPDSPLEILYALSDPAIARFIAENLADYQLTDRRPELASLIPDAVWQPGPVQDLAWRYAVAHSLRHYIMADDVHAAEQLAFNADYLAARMGLGRGRCVA